MTKRRPITKNPARKRTTRTDRRLDHVERLLKKMFRLMPLCGAGPSEPCQLPKGHEGPHIWEWQKTVASLRDQIADLKTPTAREQVLIASTRLRCNSVGPKPDYYRCGRDANHHGNHDKVIPPDAPWFPGPCTCPEGKKEPSCVQHGTQRKEDRDQ